MEVSRNNNINTSQTNQTKGAKKKSDNLNFGANFSVSNAIVTTMDTIERGGLAASFLIQDNLGTNVPRTITALNRNKEETGKLNYMNAAEVAIREFVTGPSLFIIPAVTMFLSKKLIGKAMDVPKSTIESLSDIFSNSIKNIDIKSLPDKNVAKQNFYKETFKNMIRVSTGESVENLDNIASDMAKKLINIEKAPKKSFLKTLLAKKVDGSRQDLAKELTDDFIKIRKKYSTRSDENFLNARLNINNNKTSQHFGSMLNYMNSLFDDAYNTLTKQSKKSNNKTIEQIVNKFKINRSNLRFASNILTTLAIGAFCAYIPKLYTLSDKNPALDGLIDENMRAKLKEANNNETNAI